jgi:hypothetical protein
MLSVEISYCYAECNHAECHYVESRYAYCRGARKRDTPLPTISGFSGEC